MTNSLAQSFKFTGQNRVISTTTWATAVGLLHLDMKNRSLLFFFRLVGEERALLWYQLKSVVQSGIKPWGSCNLYVSSLSLLRHSHQLLRILEEWAVWKKWMAYSPASSARVGYISTSSASSWVCFPAEDGFHGTWIIRGTRTPSSKLDILHHMLCCGQRPDHPMEVCQYQDRRCWRLENCKLLFTAVCMNTKTLNFWYKIVS